MYRLFLAIRYLVTRPINLLGMAGITISVWALIVVVSLFSGFLKVVEQHVHAASADISVTGLQGWTRWSELEGTLADDPNIAAIAPRLVHYGLLLRPGQRPAPAPLPGRGALHGGDQPFLFVLGIEPARENEVTGLHGWLTDPELPPALRVTSVQDPLARRDGLPTVLIGIERMQRDGLVPGDHVQLTTARLIYGEGLDKTTEKVQLELVVAGAFKTAHVGFDGNNVFVARDTLQQLLYAHAPDFVGEVSLRVVDPTRLDETADRLQRRVHGLLEQNATGFGIVQTWRERNGQFLGSVEHQRGLLKIVLIVIMVVAAFLMLATLSMMVTEKVSDIGILTAMGGTPNGVTTVFLACGLVITGLGVLLGTGLGIVTAVYLEEVRQLVRWATGIDLFPLDVYNLDRVPCAIEPLWLLQVAGMALVTGFVVSVLPALRAARHDPLVSLRGS